MIDEILQQMSDDLMIANPHLSDEEARRRARVEYMSIVSSVIDKMGNTITPSHIEQCVGITLLRCIHG